METVQSTVEEVSGNLYIMNNLNDFLTTEKKYTVVKIVNALSLSMIPQNTPDTFTIKRVSLEEAKKITNNADEIISAIGHTDTARIVGDLLDIELKPNRISIVLDPSKHTLRGKPDPSEKEEILIAQYSGPRLPEGTTVLPEGAAITFWTIDWFTFYELI